MLTYILTSGLKQSAHLKTGDTLLEKFWINKTPYNKRSPLYLDKDYMINKYGFSMSDYELDLFFTHFEIWKRFKRSAASFCLIINENASFKFPCDTHIRKLNKILSRNQNWDVYFPFEREEVKEDDFEFGYLLGCYWGVDAYCISRKGIDKLLSIDTIRQPLDEEILTRSILGELEVYYENSNCFDFQENIIQKRERRLEIKKAIFHSQAWSTESKQRIHILLKKISDLAIDNNIKLILSDGSLLGQVRHGAIMPWDDDVDLAINKIDYELFSSILKHNATLTHNICYWGLHKIPYCKIWGQDGYSINGYPYTFPFVDIWFFTDTEDKIIFNTGTTYTNEMYYPFYETLFEGSIFNLPSQPLKCLDVLYSDWRNKIRVYPWSHRIEKESAMPLSYNIMVDTEGRMIG